MVVDKNDLVVRLVSIGYPRRASISASCGKTTLRGFQTPINSGWQCTRITRWRRGLNISVPWTDSAGRRLVGSTMHGGIGYSREIERILSPPRRTRTLRRRHPMALQRRATRSPDIVRFSSASTLSTFHDLANGGSVRAELRTRGEP